MIGTAIGVALLLLLWRGCALVSRQVAARGQRVALIDMLGLAFQLGAILIVALFAIQTSVFPVLRRAQIIPQPTRLNERVKALERWADSLKQLPPRAP